MKKKKKLSPQERARRAALKKELCGDDRPNYPRKANGDIRIWTPYGRGYVGHEAPSRTITIEMKKLREGIRLRVAELKIKLKNNTMDLDEFEELRRLEMALE